MRLLGLDPGLLATGWGVIDVDGNELSHVANGVVRPNNGAPLSDRLATLYAALHRIVVDFSPDEAAVEETFANRNPASTLKLGQARGAAMVACLSHNLPIEEYSARQVKQAVAGTGSAAKNQVQYMVKALLRISDNIDEDAADALAIAICHANTQNSLIRMAGSKPYSKKHVRS